MKSSTKRFGARYGDTLRKKLAEVEKQQKKTYKCPYCSYEKVKREAAGIWKCSKCNARFTSRSYTIAKVELK